MHVQLHAVSKTFTDSATPLPALAPTTLEIASGEFVSFVGPSGCGKSTLLRLIADQVAPTRGTIALDGASTAEARTHKRVAWMAQNPALLPWKTVIDNVRLPQVVNRAGPAAAPKHQAAPGHQAAPDPLALLRMVELEDFATAYPKTLSGGMQQRVALARALATGAGLWLMDEPFSALDEITRERLTEELLGLWRRFSPTVLWVTHNVIEAARMADRVAVMTQGPGQIREVVTIRPPRPRDVTSPEMGTTIRYLRQLLQPAPMPGSGPLL
jgi:NitT/TauT family transport system ATP-binding protein